MSSLPWLRLTAATVLLFLSIWIVIPAPALSLLAFGVAAPELSPLLLAVSILVSALLMWKLRWSRLHRVAWGVAMAATLLCALPLAQFPSTVRRFDQAMSAVYGTAPATSSGVQSRRRPGPLVVSELLSGLDTGVAREVRGRQFAAPGGVALTVDIYRPVAPGRFPILVQIYGGAWQRGAPGDTPAFARYFASRGYTVFAIDYRHAPRWQWPAQMEDVRAALAWIRAHADEYDGDVTRTALVGRSAGAHLALMAAYLEGAPKVSAVVSYYGPTDLAEGWRVPPRPDPLDVRSVLEAFLGGTPDQVPDRYREASPVTHVSAKTPPTLLVYGSRDHIVEARFGRLLQDRLRAAGAVSALLEIPWAEHAFDALPNGLSGQLSLYYTERFLEWALRSRS